MIISSVFFVLSAMVFFRVKTIGGLFLFMILIFQAVLFLSFSTLSFQYSVLLLLLSLIVGVSVFSLFLRSFMSSGDTAFLSIKVKKQEDQLE